MPAYRCVRAAITEVSSLQMPTKVGCSFLVFPNVPFLKKLCAGYTQEVLSAEHLLHHRHTKEGRGDLIPAPLGTPHPWCAAVRERQHTTFTKAVSLRSESPFYNLLRGGCKIAVTPTCTKLPSTRTVSDRKSYVNIPAKPSHRRCSCIIAFNDCLHKGLFLTLLKDEA